MEKSKKIDASNKDCANCESSGAKLTCGKCKSAHYCSEDCQKQHWKNGHKGACIAPEKRRPEAFVRNSIGAAAEETPKVNESSECPICLDFLSDGALCTLPCKHELHRECVAELRKHGVLQACPLCRTALPDGPEKLFDHASRIYVSMERRVVSGKASWLSLTAPQKKLMAEVEAEWTTAANQGHAQAQFNLGSMYETGEGVSQNLEKAVQWTQKAADQGVVEAQFNLGRMYETGEGVAQDLEEAARWTQKAAEQGIAIAQYNIGVMYRDGEGVAQDLEEAARWTQKAAEQGVVEAQYNLALMYIDGEGVIQDHKEAKGWGQKAANQGHPNAQYVLLKARQLRKSKN